MLSQSINPRCSIGFIRLKHRIGPITDARTKAGVITTAMLMGVPVNAAKQRAAAQKARGK
jgi:hypothetical protein